MDTTFLAWILVGMAALILACGIGLCCLWNVHPDRETRDPGDPMGLQKQVKAVENATLRNGRGMDAEEALLLALRVRSRLTAGLLAFASLVLICGTIMICVYISNEHPKAKPEGTPTGAESTNQTPSNSSPSNIAPALRP